MQQRDADIVQNAMEMLGPDNVFLETGKPALGKQRKVVCPSVGQLRECSHQNQSGAHQWFLFYCSDLSLLEQEKELALSGRRFWTDYTAEEFEKLDFASVKPVAGFYLLDLFPRWQMSSWLDQERNIELLGADYQRAPENIFSQAAVAYRNRKGEPFFKNTFHWGSAMDASECNICIALFSNVRLRISSVHPSRRNSNILAVCLARKSPCQCTISI